MFKLSPGFDPKHLAEMFRSYGRIQITDFLSPGSAKAFYTWLAESAEWRLTVNRGEQIFHFDLDEVASWDSRKIELLETAASAGGRYGFQFRYEVIRVGEDSTTPLAQFAAFLSSPEVAGLLRTITGADDVTFADAHASRYRPGHFLTTHDDRVDSMGRRAAYVLNLTPEWRPDWGGLLQFFDNRGDVTRAFTPGFNLLNIFRVPQAHNVSWVTPLAGAPRYAVTGWLRAGAQ